MDTFCTPPPLTDADLQCRHNKDYTLRGVSEETCNELSCCTYNESSSSYYKCFPKTDGTVCTGNP